MEVQEFTQESPETGIAAKRDLANRLGTVGWALFFIWVGIAFLATLEIGVGLIGIGIITLGMQALRGSMKLRIEGFWIVIGLLFALGGIWELVEPTAPLVPVLLIVAGLLLIISVIRRSMKAK